MRLKITVCIAISAMIHFFVLTHSAQSAEDVMLLDGTISSAQGADDYQFRQGFPSGKTAANAYHNSLTRRAIEAYKTFLPTIATEAVIQQMLNAGAVANKIGINMDQGPRQQFAATNSDTPYNLIIFDLREGPMVVDMPANPLLLGLVNDHNMRWIENLGGIGPDKGKGGRYLFLPPGYEGEIPEGYFVSKSRTHMVVAAIRSVPLDGDGAKAIKAAQEIKAYPLGESRETTDWRWIDASKDRLPLPLLDWEARLDYWRVLHDVIQYEVPQDEDRFTMGSLEQFGITKGAPFSPGTDMEKILSKSAIAAHAELSVVLYANPDPTRIMWDDRKWELIPLATMHLPKGDFGTKSLISRDAWDQFFFFGWGTSSTIGVRKPGGGSIYFLSFKDKKDVYLDGAKSYKLTMPDPVPAGLFWSVTVYDAETRVLIETSQGRAAVRSHRDSPQPNDDGSFDIHFGPVAPEGKESNWVQTLPGRGWFTAVRLYSPAKEVFDGTWRLGDIISSE
jgi:hypothetical protein